MFLHVGSDKAGSTAIQNAFNMNRKKLGSNGYLYAPNLYHPLLAAYFTENPDKFDYTKLPAVVLGHDELKTQAREYMRALVDEIERTNHHSLVISYEGFAGLTEAEFAALKKFFNNYSDSIEIIYYIRPALSYAQSAMSERVKHGFFSWNIHPPIVEHRAFLSKLINVFGKRHIRLREYNREKLIKGDAVVDFMQLIGLPEGLLSELEVSNSEYNPALSEEATNIGDEIISLLRGADIQGVKFKSLFGATLQRIQGRRYNLTKLQQEVINRATKGDVEYIASEFGLNISQKATSNFHTISALSRPTAHSIAKLIIEGVLPDFELPDIDAGEYRAESVITRAPGTITAKDSTEIKLAPLEVKTLRVEVANESSFWWGGKIAPVRASYHWFNADKKLVELDGLRSELPDQGIGPGDKSELSVMVSAPEISGDYYLELTLVQEYFNWFEDIGFQSQIIKVSVN